jgi:hypothetical protein
MGEQAKNIGHDAEEKIYSLLDALGYETQDSGEEKYNIDAIEESPVDNPRVGLAIPRYAPNGLVAIEVKEPVASKKKVDDFKKKITDYNRDNNRKLTGGIYIADCKMSESMLEYMKVRGIYGWDQKRLRLYHEKVAMYNYWSFAKKFFVSEVPIDSSTSLLRISTLSRKQLLRLSVFFDDSNRKLSPGLLKEILEKIRQNTLSPLLELGIRPLNVYFEFKSIGGMGSRLHEEIYRTVARPWEEQGISVLVDIDSFQDYRTFPTI